MNRHRVCDLLESAGIEFVVIGAVAVAARGASRSTLDFDVLTVDRRVFDQQLWEPLRNDGIPVDIRKGDFDDPLGGVVRIGSRSNQVDIVVGKWKWEQGVIKRSSAADVDGFVLRVPLTPDLILLKVVAGGRRDMMDAATLLDIGPRDPLIAQVAALIADLPESLRSGAEETWRRVLEL